MNRPGKIHRILGITFAGILCLQNALGAIPATASSADSLTGLWQVKAIDYDVRDNPANNTIVDINQSDKLRDLYDGVVLGINDDGTFAYMNQFISEGTITESTKDAGCYVLKTDSCYRLSDSNGEVKKIESDSKSSFIIEDMGDILHFQEYDPFTGKAKANDNGLYFEKTEEKPSLIRSLTEEESEKQETEQNAGDATQDTVQLDGDSVTAESGARKQNQANLPGYGYLEYFLGTWEADLANPTEKGEDVYPTKMTFTISDDNLWFDSGINGFQRLRFPVTIDYSMMKNGSEETGTAQYDGYLLFKLDTEDGFSDKTIIFGKEKNGLWYNFTKVDDDTAECSFIVVDETGKNDYHQNNRFDCIRTTEQQKTESETNGADADMDHDAYGGLSANNDDAGMTSFGEQNALNKAYDYLEFAAFSYSGLIDQLEFEGYSASEATYAADHCGADWNEQAARKAGEYLDYSSFSREGLIKQLEFEGFTHAQAEYGVSQNGY